MVRHRARIFIALTASPLSEEPAVQTVFDFLAMEAAPKVVRSNRFYRGLPVNKEEYEEGTASEVDSTRKPVPARNRRGGVRSRQNKGPPEAHSKGEEVHGGGQRSSKSNGRPSPGLSKSMKQVNLGD